VSRAPRQGMPRRRRGTSVSPARSAALNAALLTAKRGKPLDGALEHVLAAEKVSHRDRRLAGEIAFGSVRHRASIDMILSSVSSRPVQDIQAAALEALRQAIYQTFYLERIPEHAAVGEAVQLVRNLAGGKVAGFTNAVLRAALRLRSCRESISESAREPRSELSFRSGEVIRLSRELLPDPEVDTAGWLAAHYSYPRELVAQLLSELDRREVDQVLAWGNEIPHLGARVNCLRSGDPALLAGSPDELCGPGKVFAGCSGAVALDLPGAYCISPEQEIGSLPGLRKGLFSIQDETQQRVAAALAPKAGERILDICAAPGGKSMHMAELSGGGAKIVACDPDAQRLALVEDSAARLGFSCVQTRRLEVPPLPSELAGTFDAVLADVPCSNTGSMNRRVESRWRVSSAATARLVDLQLGILKAAAGAVRKRGRLVYSTCSILSSENFGVVREFLASAGDARLLKEELTLPRAGRRDGGYFAVLEP